MEMNWKTMSDKEWSIFVIEGLLKGIQQGAIDFSKCIGSSAPGESQPYIQSMAVTGLKNAMEYLKK